MKTRVDARAVAGSTRSGKRPRDGIQQNLVIDGLTEIRRGA